MKIHTLSIYQSKSNRIFHDRADLFSWTDILFQVILIYLIPYSYYLKVFPLTIIPHEIYPS